MKMNSKIAVSLWFINSFANANQSKLNCFNHANWSEFHADQIDAGQREEFLKKRINESKEIKEDQSIEKEVGLTNQQYLEVIAKVENTYRDTVKNLGGNLKAKNLWLSFEFNASANQTANEWTLEVHGQMARHEGMTKDGLMLVTCHELGHHIAGFPFYPDPKWASTEGQADYFSSQVCLKKIWGQDKEENAKFRTTVHPEAKKKCDKFYAQTDEQNLCYRTLSAAMTVKTVVANYFEEPLPQFDEISKIEVAATNPAHPKAQCRLDTVVAGALCRAKIDDKVIPGKNHPAGNNSFEAEKIAANYSCVTERLEDAQTIRPMCWFAPTKTLLARQKQLTQLPVDGNGDQFWEPNETFAINMPLSNKLDAPITDAKLTLSEWKNPNSNKVSRNYPIIAAGETKTALENVPFKFANKKCGETVRLNAQVTAGKWSYDHQFNVLVGGDTIFETQNNNAPLEIPELNEKGVETEIKVNSDSTADKVAVTIDLAFGGMIYLKAILISPTNKEYVILDRFNHDSAFLYKTFTIPLEKSRVKGKWKLRFVNLPEIFHGELKSWKLEFKNNRC